jgi:regulator of protease activity HflC (stomatin/prohibitin superfamily)
MGVNEALVCANYPVGSIRYSWRNAAEVNAAKAAAEKAVGDQKAKQEADAKAAADKVVAEAKAEAAKILAEANAQAKAAAAAAAAEAKAAAAAKKTTITCVKGKLTKKVIAVKPVCPKGYKKK